MPLHLNPLLFCQANVINNSLCIIFSLPKLSFLIQSYWNRGSLYDTNPTNALSREDLGNLHPGKLTCPQEKRPYFKRTCIFQPSFFRKYIKISGKYWSLLNFNRFWTVFHPSCQATAKAPAAFFLRGATGVSTVDPQVRDLKWKTNHK